MSHFNDSNSDQLFSREPLKKRAAPIWRDLRLLVAVQLYMLGRISSDRAAKLADVPHVEFLLSLGFYKVFPLQAELTELERAAALEKNKPKDPPPTSGGTKASPSQSVPKNVPGSSVDKNSTNPPHTGTQERP